MSRLPSECVTEALASRFATGIASASEREQVTSHLEAGCKSCEQLLNRIAGADDNEPWGKPWCFTTFRKGQLLDNRYRIVRYIDRGGMGEVYEAFDCLVGMRVAVKTVSSTLSDDLEASALIKTEVQNALRVNHRNVCRIYSLGLHTAPGARAILFITMELVDGITLGSRITASGKLSPTEAVRLSGEILSGMAAAHDAGVLHRDLKSDNIMLRPSRSGPPSPVLMDFGLAVALPSDASHISGDKPMVGSLPYMPPEQVQGGCLRIESDLYSFGVVLFEMLTGRVPFHSEQAGGLLKRLFEEAPRVRATAPDVPEALEEIVACCLEKDPKRRYASARAVLSALRTTQLLDESSSPESPRDSVPPATLEASEPAAPRSPRSVEPTLTAATSAPVTPDRNSFEPGDGSPDLRIATPVSLVLDAAASRSTARPLPVKQGITSAILVSLAIAALVGFLLVRQRAHPLQSVSGVRAQSTSSPAPQEQQHPRTNEVLSPVNAQVSQPIFPTAPEERATPSVPTSGAQVRARAGSTPATRSKAVPATSQAQRTAPFPLSDVPAPTIAPVGSSPTASTGPRNRAESSVLSGRKCPEGLICSIPMRTGGSTPPARAASTSGGVDKP